MTLEKNIFFINDLSELQSVAQTILLHLKHPLVLFVGDLGAGKTTLIKSMIQELGSADLGSSPSYSIINKYQTEKGHMFHIDLYRLENAQDVFNLGIEEIFYGGAQCFVEWPQIVYDYIDSPYHILTFEIQENNSRKITLSTE